MPARSGHRREMTASGVKESLRGRAAAGTCLDTDEHTSARRGCLCKRAICTPPCQPSFRRSSGPASQRRKGWVARAPGGPTASSDPLGCKHPAPQRRRSAGARRRRRSQFCNRPGGGGGGGGRRRRRRRRRGRRAGADDRSVTKRDHRAADGGVIATDGMNARRRRRERDRARSEAIVPASDARRGAPEPH